MSGEQTYNYYGHESYLLDKEMRTVLASIDAGDQITHMARQRRRSLDVLFPSVIITTLNKLVIVDRSLLGLKSHIMSIPYRDISGVRVTHGMIVSSLFLNVKEGVNGSSRLGRSRGEIRALDTKDADILFTQLNATIAKRKSPDTETAAARSGNGTVSISSSVGVGQEVGTAILNKIRGSGYHTLVKETYKTFGTLKRVLNETPTMQKAVMGKVMKVSESITSAKTDAEKQVKSRRITAEDLIIFRARKGRGGMAKVRFGSLVKRLSNGEQVSRVSDDE